MLDSLGTPGPSESDLKVAIVHEWLSTYAGSERVLEQLIACYPQAALFAVVDFLPSSQRAFLRGRPVRTSYIQKLPFARRLFRHYLGLMPLAVEQFDLSGFDLVITSSHSVAKGVITGPDQIHVSYVHSPMRYAWDMQHQYLEHANLQRGLKSLYARWLLSRLRLWDIRTSNSVDVFVANSRYIARRIRKAYRREAEVIFPPVDVDGFAFCPAKGDYYFVASRQVPYKRIDLIAAAFAGMPSRKLVIVGEGPANAAVRAAAGTAANITLLPAVGQDKLHSLMSGAKAMVFAAEEDFGITMVEAQACGTPVISFARGGAMDIVVEGGVRPATGILFHAQTPEAIRDAVARFESQDAVVTPAACRANAMQFSSAVFRSRIMQSVEQALRTQRERQADRQCLSPFRMPLDQMTPVVSDA